MFQVFLVLNWVTPYPLLAFPGCGVFTKTNWCPWWKQFQLQISFTRPSLVFRWERVIFLVHSSSPKRRRAAIRGTHARNFAQRKVRAPKLLCTCSMAQITTMASYNLKVAMYLFKCSSHKGGELRSGVPMFRLSLSQGAPHLSCNVPIRGLWPQWWRVAISGAHVQIVSKPRVNAPESKCTCKIPDFECSQREKIPFLIETHRALLWISF